MVSARSLQKGPYKSAPGLEQGWSRL
jgi:hypothetical protein